MSVDRLLRPESIALIGASRRGGMSGSILTALRDYGYRGDVYLVNPSGESIDGVQTYASILDLPPDIDLGLVLVPAAHVSDAIRECGARGIGSAVVFSAGFMDDRDPTGAMRQEDLAKAAQVAGLRIMGPNSEGFINLVDGVPISFSSSISLPQITTALGLDEGSETGTGEPVSSEAKGNVAIVAQSGGLAFSLFNRGLARGLRFSYVISCGNEVDFEAQDYLEFMLEDSLTDVILMYVEGFKDPGRFQVLASQARALGKRVVIAKVGRTTAAARAALSHTGRLAGDAAAFDAVLKHHGIVGVDDPEELLDVGLALSMLPAASSTRTAIVSFSGGSGVWMADACAAAGLSVEELDVTTQQKLSAALPSFAAISNPVDISGASILGPGDTLALVADDANTDALILISTLSNVERMRADEAALRGIRGTSEKPIVVYSYTDPSRESRVILHELGIPCYSGIRRCVRSLKALATVGSRPDADEPLVGLPVHQIRDLIKSFRSSPGGSLREYQAKELLKICGITVTRGALAGTPAEAERIARRIGLPVALKLQSSMAPHKAKMGGIRLGVTTLKEVRTSFRQLVVNGQERGISATDLDGILVEEMMPPGIELIAGIQNTSGLGPMVLTGLGGSAAEAADRTILSPAPFGPRKAQDILEEIGLSKILSSGGETSDPRSAVERASDVFSRLSVLASACANELSEMDLNPVVINADGSVTVVDALGVTAAARESGSFSNEEVRPVSNST